MANAMPICTSYQASDKGQQTTDRGRVTNTRKEGRVIVLSTVTTSWRESFHSVDVQFGSQAQNAPLERHDHHLKKRQDDTTTASTATSPSVRFPPAPSSSPTSTRIAAASITSAWVGTTILPPTFPGADLLVPDIPLGLNVKCKNCSIQGSLDLSSGTINMSGLNGTSDSSPDATDFLDIFDPSIDDIIDFYQEGYVELTVNDFAAHIELESTVRPSAELITYIAPFPDIGIPGWVIPRIAEVGPVLRPQVIFGVELATELAFTYGFDLRIPNNSTIHLDINDPISNSTVTGFQDTKFNAIPFQSQVNSINLTVFAAFNPQLLLTISILDRDAEISAGAFLDLPKLSATVAQVNQVDEKCNPANKSSDGIKEFADGSLTNIVPKVEFGVGVLMNAQLDVPAFTADIGAETTLASTGYPLPTACISYDGKAKTYGAAAAANTKKVSGGVRVGEAFLRLFSGLFVAIVLSL